MLDAFLFFLFAVLAVLGGVGLLVTRSPIHAALSVVVTMFSIACLYLTLNAAFIGVIQILVYAGAIMVLFLFVIMLLNLDDMPSLRAFKWGQGVAFVLGVAVVAQLLALVALRFDAVPEAVSPEAAAANASAASLGAVLLTDYAYHLQIVGLLLLAATIGAVLLAKKRFA
ncbi:MAG: NADH-quinone oxidoreductase subunit J [Bacteroidota bacterium]